MSDDTGITQLEAYHTGQLCRQFVRLFCWPTDLEHPHARRPVKMVNACISIARQYYNDFNNFLYQLISSKSGSYLFRWPRPENPGNLEK